jgi:acetyltransferase
MISRPLAEELIVGVSQDRTFGAAILFGKGGVAVEVIGDRVMGLPPLNSALARDLIARTRVAKLLAGYRNRPPADIAAIARALVSVSDLIADLPEIAELDINPLLADADGVIALDARIVVRASGEQSAPFAIRPYPAELTRDLTLSNGARVSLRAIRPEDGPALVEMAAVTDPQDLRLRFHGAMRALDPRAAARLSQIDYDREMALVAVGEDETLGGVVRIVFDPEFEAGEYAIIVRSDLQGQGIGRELLGALLAYARARGAKRVWGDVMSENYNMLTLAREMGAHTAKRVEARGLTRTEFRLDSD